MSDEKDGQQISIGEFVFVKLKTGAAWSEAQDTDADWNLRWLSRREQDEFLSLNWVASELREKGIKVMVFLHYDCFPDIKIRRLNIENDDGVAEEVTLETEMLPGSFAVKTHHSPVTPAMEVFKKTPAFLSAMEKK